MSNAGAGAETAGAVVPGAGAAGCDSTCGTGTAAGAAFESDVVGVTAGWVSVDAGVFSAGGGVAGAGATELVAEAAPGSGVVAAGEVAAGAGWFEFETISPAF